MDWKLIFKLSLFGLAMALATVSIIPSNLEPLFWLVILLLTALAIARVHPHGEFRHGLLVGIANSIWVTTAHILFFHRYISNHPAEAAMSRSMPLEDSPRLMMALVGPLIGIVTGVIIGLIAMIASRFIFRRKDA